MRALLGFPLSCNDSFSLFVLLTHVACTCFTAFWIFHETNWNLSEHSRLRLKINRFWCCCWNCSCHTRWLRGGWQEERAVNFCRLDLLSSREEISSIMQLESHKNCRNRLTLQKSFCPWTTDWSWRPDLFMSVFIALFLSYDDNNRDWWGCRITRKV